MKQFQVNFIIPSLGSIVLAANSKEDAIKAFKQFDGYFLMNYTTALEDTFFCENCDVNEFPLATPIAQ